MPQISTLMNIVCEDSNAFDPTCKTGYYTVGNKIFYRKLHALHEASRAKVNPTWHFHNDVYSQAIRNHKEFVGLPNLYKLRAQQLRDKYDYIILAFSGGSDSDTVLKAFLDNGIKLDEVWHDTPLKFIEQSGYVPNYSKSNTNMPSEYFFVVKPELEKLAKDNNVKIHFSDACADPDVEDREDTSMLVTTPVYYSLTKRWRYIDDYMKALKHQRVCLVLGVDKIKPWYKNNRYGFFFFDDATWCKLPNVEYFFWTPEMPEITVEQAKTVWKYLMVDEQATKARFKLNQQHKSVHLHRALSFDEIVKSITYPTWDTTKHQVNKYSIFKNEHVKWYNDTFKDEYFFQSWATNYTESIKNLDPVYACHNKLDFSDDLAKFNIYHDLGEIKWNF